MNGNEIITITIEDPHTQKRLSTMYSLLNANNYKGARGEYHLMMIDQLIEGLNREKRK
jgi:hypothetical protein